MVVNKTISRLVDIGFSEYEARLYVSLLRANPATAYEIAKESGIPTSKIYEVIARLMEKGFVSVVDADSKKSYIPMDIDEFIEGRRKKIDKTLEGLKSDLSGLKTAGRASYIWNVDEYGYFLEKAERMILEAKKSILISAWKNEILNLKDILEKKAKYEKVKIAIVHFGEVEIAAGRLYQHPIENTIYNEKGGRGFAIVVDSREALMGTIHDKALEGAWSINNGFVTLAEDYIKHDIYIMKIVSRMDKMLKKRFGDNYIKLRDIYSDEEAI